MTLRTPAFNDAKSYGFEWLRALLETDLQEGVFNAGDLKVTAAAGGGMKVDIAAGQACVKGDSGVAGTGLSQGLFYVVNDAAVANAVTLNAADATNPRVDQIVLHVRDSSDLGSGADDALFEVVVGAPTAGATLDNRNGAAALPNDRVRLADVLVPAASVAVTAGNVRDRRPWARGAYRRIIRTANAAAGNDYTTSSTAGAEVDATNLKPRIECSGAPLRLTFRGFAAPSAIAQVGFSFFQDGAVIDGISQSVAWAQYGPVAAQNVNFNVVYEALPPAGSHLFSPLLSISTGTLTTSARSTFPLQLIIDELVRQNADNT